MKKIIKSLFILCLSVLLISIPVNLSAQTSIEDEKPDKAEEIRATVVTLPISAVCNYQQHKNTYATFYVYGKIKSRGGYVIWVGTTPVYLYTYTDEYNNYYVPYYGGYWDLYESALWASGCPLNNAK